KSGQWTSDDPDCCAFYKIRLNLQFFGFKFSNDSNIVFRNSSRSSIEGNELQNSFCLDSSVCIARMISYENVIRKQRYFYLFYTIAPLTEYLLYWQISLHIPLHKFYIDLLLKFGHCVCGIP